MSIVEKTAFPDPFSSELSARKNPALGAEIYLLYDGGRAEFT
jgi:hypothetical protein